MDLTMAEFKYGTAYYSVKRDKVALRASVF